MKFHRTVVQLLTIPTVLALGGATIARATVISGATISATFTDPVLFGDIANDPGVGDVAFVDNTSTAVYSGVGTNSISWGTDTGLPPGEEYSQLTFTGNSGIDLSSTTPQTIGTISYLNGTSALNSLIFGATMNFYATTQSGTQWLGSDNVIITTTSNQATGNLALDADYINICGNSSNICGSSLEAYEDSETGLLSPVVANLQADLDFSLDGITVTADTTNLGTVGNLPPIGQVPEPSSVVLMLTMLGGCGFIFARRSAKRAL